VEIVIGGCSAIEVFEGCFEVADVGGGWDQGWWWWGDNGHAGESGGLAIEIGLSSLMMRAWSVSSSSLSSSGDMV
jgi:hypothetical protein